MPILKPKAFALPTSHRTDARKRLSHKIRPLAHPEGLLSDAAKLRNKSETCKEKLKKSTNKPVF